MKNKIQPYAWGSHYAIGQLLGQSIPTKVPQAELWMGAHPKAPSSVFWQGGWHPLTEILTDHAAEILGEKGAEAYGTQLPYLLKVLAAEMPLSIQAHPDKVQAQSGFVREEQLQVPLDAAHRNYKDRNHKPECLCALTPFWALCGFRPITQIISLMKTYLPSEFEYLLHPIKHPENVQKGLQTFFKQLITLPQEAQLTLVKFVVAKAEKKADASNEAQWIQTISSDYPGDIGVLSPLFLNLIKLAPGEAIFLNAGVLHAYLHGTGIEIMANSDNVLRGGLTTKHIDVNELMHVLTFENGTLDVQLPVDSGPCEKKLLNPVEEFELSIITVKNSAHYSSATERGAEILFCTEGKTCLTNLSDHTDLNLAKGESVLIPNDLTRYELSGQGVVYKARGPVESGLKQPI